MIRLLAACCLLLCFDCHAQEPLRLYAAASLTNALRDITDAYTARGRPAVKNVFAASSTLAKQIETGARADLFLSADPGWMDYLTAAGRIEPTTRTDLLGNTLVLIAPKGKGFTVDFGPGSRLARAFSGRLCTGEPGVVPVGIYAKQALENLGWWTGLQGRIVGTEDVRTALAFVERGECAAGIVYATDAAISDKVEVVGRFPASSHKAIVYPAAVVKGATADAADLLAWLRSEQAAAIFVKHGFQPLSLAP